MVGVRRANASVTREFLSRPLRSQMWQGLLKRRFVDRLLWSDDAKVIRQPQTSAIRPLRRST